MIKLNIIAFSQKKLSDIIYVLRHTSDILLQLEFSVNTIIYLSTYLYDWLVKRQNCSQNSWAFIFENTLNLTTSTPHSKSVLLNCLGFLLQILRERYSIISNSIIQDTTIYNLINLLWMCYTTHLALEQIILYHQLMTNSLRDLVVYSVTSRVRASSYPLLLSVIFNLFWMSSLTYSVYLYPSKVNMETDKYWKQISHLRTCWI